MTATTGGYGMIGHPGGEGARFLVEDCAPLTIDAILEQWHAFYLLKALYAFIYPFSEKLPKLIALEDDGVDDLLQRLHITPLEAHGFPHPFQGIPGGNDAFVPQLHQKGTDVAYLQKIQGVVVGG
jgi:hypothetical protein